MPRWEREGRDSETGTQKWETCFRVVDCDVVSTCGPAHGYIVMSYCHCQIMECVITFLKFPLSHHFLGGSGALLKESLLFF